MFIIPDLERPIPFMINLLGKCSRLEGDGYLQLQEIHSLGEKVAELEQTCQRNQSKTTELFLAHEESFQRDLLKFSQDGLLQTQRFEQQCVISNRENQALQSEVKFIKADNLDYKEILKQQKLRIETICEEKSNLETTVNDLKKTIDKLVAQIDAK